MIFTATMVGLAALLASRRTERAFPFESVLALGLTGLLLVVLFKTGDLW